MLTAVALFLAGLIVLIGGSELLVRGGSQLAAHIGIPPLLIGLTIVAIGTSVPELAVGIEAVLEGSGALAVGNIAGTNTVNILFILGLGAMLTPISLGLRTLRLELPMMVATALALFAMSWDGMLTRMEGALLVGAGILYTAALIFGARRESLAVTAGSTGEYGVAASSASRRKTAVNLALLAIGIAVIVVGADWLVIGAVDLARRMNVSDAFIGLTIVAIGTSAPELVTTVVSTLRHERDIAIGNLIGSSIYNILLILGVTALVPSAGIAIEPHLVHIDIPVMCMAAIACIPVFISGRRMTRPEGMVFVTSYGIYLAYLVFSRG